MQYVNGAKKFYPEAVESESDPDSTLVEFFGSGSDRILKSRFWIGSGSKEYGIRAPLALHARLHLRSILTPNLLLFISKNTTI